jgi:hypothetical protein
MSGGDEPSESATGSIAEKMPKKSLPAVGPVDRILSVER